ncbi:MAG: PHP domain-containing protein [Candidatus Aenigmarchaeota archaeon]|nr:PHP domain-containing protein [Candidatus Aenigmarchaeota archaeon]
MLKCDFHIHTRYSPDSNLSPDLIIKTAIKKKLDVIGVVDHDIFKGGPETKKLAAKIAPSMVVIPGEEIKTLSGEIIAFGIQNTIPRKLTLRKTIEEAKKQNAFIVVPHPFEKIRQGLGNAILGIKDDIDAVEAFNSRCFLGSFNKKALKFATENNIPVIAGSDSHFDYEIGSGYTYVDAEPDENSVLDAIKKGRTEIGGKITGLKPHFRTFIQKRLSRD